MGASQKRVRIATMAEPVPADLEKAMIVTVYQARECLSSAGQQTMASCDGVKLAEEALAHLRFVYEYTNGEYVGWHYRVRLLAERAVVATESAIALQKVVMSYTLRLGFDEKAGEERSDADFEEKQLKRADRRWDMAVVAARQETHRLLAELAEVFPNAYDVEEL